MQGMAQKLAEIQRTLDLNGVLRDELAAIGRKIDTLKGISLDITEQLSAVEHTIEGKERDARKPPEHN